MTIGYLIGFKLFTYINLICTNRFLNKADSLFQKRASNEEISEMKTRKLINCSNNIKLLKDCFNGTKHNKIVNKTLWNQIITNRTHSYEIYLSIKKNNNFKLKIKIISLTNI